MSAIQFGHTRISDSMYLNVIELLVVLSVFDNISLIQCLVSTHSDSNVSSKFLTTCCDSVNWGKNIISEGDAETVSMFLCPLMPPLNCPVIAVHQSCKSIIDTYPNSTSGYYNIILSNGSDISVYCDMKGVNCDGEGGWTRIAHVNMSEPGASCPDGLFEEEFNDSLSWRTLCTINSWTEDYHVDVCNSTTFSVHDIEYSQICGYVRGYQHGLGVGHFIYALTDLNILLSENPYFTGVSIVHNNNSELSDIWTYLSAWAEEYNNSNDLNSRWFSCPCDQAKLDLNISNISIPFDYYCESGRPTDDSSYSKLYIDDPLWDGKQCSESESLCCTEPNMPWFFKILDDYSDEDIQIRLCGWASICSMYNNCTDYYATPIDIIEIFIK